MTHRSKSACALACFAALSLPSIAQSNPWNGSWKSDPASLKYDGPTYSVASDAEGFTITRAGTPSPKVMCNGQPNANPDGTSTTCTKSGDGYQMETTKDGKTVNKGTVSFSPDGNMLTRKMEFFPAEGSPYTMTFTSARVSGGPGFSGTWKQKTFQESQDNGILGIQVTGDTVAFKETDNDKPISCKLDGTETKFPNGGSMSVKLADPHTLKVTYRGDDGKVRRENTFVLSADGNTVTETDVTPAPAPSTMSLVFHKS